jgi:Domain of unknown function (DUF4331)
MSHHLDTPTAREDGRVDLCDLYVFEGADPDTTVLIMTVNPMRANHRLPLSTLRWCMNLRSIPMGTLWKI